MVSWLLDRAEQEAVLVESDGADSVAADALAGHSRKMSKSCAKCRVHQREPSRVKLASLSDISPSDFGNLVDYVVQGPTILATLGRRQSCAVGQLAF